MAEPPPPVAPMVHHCRELLRRRLEHPEVCRGLLVGCGSGDEVVFLRRAFGNKSLVGLDVSRGFSASARAAGCVLAGDASSLPFPAACFDFTAAFHSLEHVGNARTAVAEICRVLEPGGWFYLGVPNRSRLVGYLGAFGVSTWHKVTRNLKDLAARLSGRFRNELGAHAGFTAGELAALLEGCFEDVQLVTADYLRFKYRGRLPAPALDLLLAPGVINRSAASHYVICRKKRRPLP